MQEQHHKLAKPAHQISIDKTQESEPLKAKTGAREGFQEGVPSQNGRVLCAMSGGVDSSVAAKLLVDAGYDVMGVTMKLFDNDDIFLGEENRTCCSLDDVEDARGVAARLGIPYCVFNYKGKFETCVIARFCEGYLRGETPNPCIDCNRFLKFEALQQRRRELEYDYVATGHYARRVFNDELCRFELHRGADPKKDQSYVLYHITQDQLAHMLFPLGDLSKDEVRKAAHGAGLRNADKLESQDICFVPDGDYAAFIEQHTGTSFEPGPILDESGNELGVHQGLARYTLGQRKGLGVAAGQPLFVLKKDVNRNALIVGPSSSMGVREVIADDVNLITLDSLDEPVLVQAKVNYRAKPQQATAVIADGVLRVTFDEPIRSAAPGQAVVLYQGDVVVGGATIRSFI